MSPEVFCFADYPCHTVAIDILKAPPEDDNREIVTWYGPRSPAGWLSHFKNKLILGLILSFAFLGLFSCN